MSQSGVKLWCLIEDETKPFSVPADVNGDVDDLVKAVQRENRLLFDLNTSDVVLWKLNNSIQVDSDSPLAERLPSPFKLTDFAVQLDKRTHKFLDVFPGHLAEGHLYIIVQRPGPSGTGMTASWSSNSNLAYDTLKRKRPFSPGDMDHTQAKHIRTEDNNAWLMELHSKLWDREDRRQEVFHTVELTIAHYLELQKRLADLYPDRLSEEYEAKEVLSTKLDVLRYFEPPSIDPASATALAAHRIHTDNEAENEVQEESDDTENEVQKDSDDIDDELCSLFPFVLNFMDFSTLELETPPVRMPQPLLIRQEYSFLTERLGKRSAIISGQPGTGKTGYLYSRMVESMIAGTPFLYQTINGTVYHVSDAITLINTWQARKAIVAFVDADRAVVEPQEFIRLPSVQIIAASSPRTMRQLWLKQMGNSLIPLKLVAALWSPSEFFLTGIFLNPQDLTYARLRESTSYFGRNPRLCFNASVAADSLRQLMSEIKEAIFRISRKQGIGSLLSDFSQSRMLSHTIFELSAPEGTQRLFGDALVGAVSLWALNLLLEAYEQRKSDAAAEFYDSIAGDPHAGSLRGRMFERQVLKYFDSLKEPHVFSIRSLDTSSICEWVYPGPAKRVTFQPVTFAQSLQAAVVGGNPLHLVPKDPNFPALDSTVYRPGKGLSHMQVTVRTKHPVAVVGLKRIQGYLKRNTPLADLRPSKTKPWELIFPVPCTIADSFTKQSFEGDTTRQEWASKVDQYVLGIEEETIWGRTLMYNAGVSSSAGVV